MTSAPQNSPSRKLDKYIVRFPNGMRESLHVAAEVNHRSLNAEIVARLNGVSSAKPLTAVQLADALGCFWNAAISAAVDRQSATAMDVASVMALGLAAVAERLSEPQITPPEEMRVALMGAERFIAGFEDDDTQEGVADLLTTIRNAIAGGQS